MYQTGRGARSRDPNPPPPPLPAGGGRARAVVIFFAPTRRGPAGQRTPAARMAWVAWSVAAAAAACLALAWRLAPAARMLWSYACLRWCAFTKPAAGPSNKPLKVMRPPRLGGHAHFVALQQQQHPGGGGGALHARVPRPGAGDCPEA